MERPQRPSHYPSHGNQRKQSKVSPIPYSKSPLTLSLIILLAFASFDLSTPAMALCAGMGFCSSISCTSACKTTRRRESTSPRQQTLNNCAASTDHNYIGLKGIDRLNSSRGREVNPTLRRIASTLNNRHGIYLTRLLGVREETGSTILCLIYQ